VLFLVKSKSHFTEQGLNQLLEIKYGMNKGRWDIKFNEITNNSTTPLYQECGLRKQASERGRT
jgi:hypothetical protein